LPHLKNPIVPERLPIKEQSIITSSSRGVNFPSHLCSLAEQVYFAAVDRGWGANDDSGVVRLWTAEPVTSIQSDLSAEDKEAKLQLVVDLVTAVHIVSAAEAICLAKHFDIPLSQFYELASDAAGGSSMFNELGSQMIPILEGKEDGSGKILGGYIEALKKVVDEAYAVKCPLYLGSAVLNLMLQAGDSQSLGSLLKCYIS
jgi:3-hydroxyisobutyrate dehydrogenase